MTIPNQLRIKRVNALQERIFRMAQRDVNVFCEQVMRDQKTGENFLQAEVHRLMQGHINWCMENGYYAGIMAPWGWGKSAQIIGRVLHLLGQNSNRRIKIVCNIDQFATQRVSAIRDYMEKSQEYRVIFPGVVPDNKEKWGERRLKVVRSIHGTADYSLEGGGIFSAAVSGRCDVLVFDDVCDHKNSVMNSSLRKKVIESFNSNWMSRLEPDGFVIYICTPWHELDCSYFLLKNNKKFSFLIMGVAKSLDCLEVRKTWWKD